jgi:uncharacterized protein YndB with AHSA1/START domain
MENTSFLLSRTYATPLELVWKAITEKDQLKQWYFDFSEGFQLQVGSTFTWAGCDHDGKQWMHKGEMLEIIENKKLVHSWEYPDYSGTSVVSWELTKVDENTTQLDFKHEFIAPFDATEPSLRRESFVEGWTQILNMSLVEYLEK